MSSWIQFLFKSIEGWLMIQDSLLIQNEKCSISSVSLKQQLALGAQNGPHSSSIKSTWKAWYDEKLRNIIHNSIVNLESCFMFHNFFLSWSFIATFYDILSLLIRSSTRWEIYEWNADPIHTWCCGQNRQNDPKKLAIFRYPMTRGKWRQIFSQPTQFLP